MSKTTKTTGLTKLVVLGGLAAVTVALVLSGSAVLMGFAPVVAMVSVWVLCR